MTAKQSYPKMHVSLYVTNISDTIKFYTDFFGKEANKVKSGYAKYVLEKPALIISFIENADKVQASFGHLGFQVETKALMEKHLEAMKAKGVIVREEIGTACCYAVQDKFWVSDPDGYQWEVYYFHEDVEFNDPHHRMEGEAEACCSPSMAVDEEANAKPKVRVSLSGQPVSACEPGSGCC